jgi:formate dehydrogenase alpha subunit
LKAITVTIDGREVSGRPGTTILELAQEVGIKIPTLCYHQDLRPFGACRICLVEDEGTGRLLASCVTPIAPGMRILTRSPSVLETRRVIVRLMMANHPESCIVCDKGNRCQLRQLAAELGIGHIDYDRMPSYVEVKDLNPFIARDLSKCILCAKCIRADHELVGVGALDYLHRGFAARPATLLEGPLEGSECTFCGTCVTMCPTGALMEKDLFHRGTVGSRVSTTCSYCGCGCSLWVHTLEDRLVNITPREEGSANQATLCVRGHYGGDYLHHPERLFSPLIRSNGELQTASWDEVLDEVTQRLQEIRDRHGPHALGFFGSTQCTNEENYLFQKIARIGFCSPHVDNGARIHAISSVMGLCEVLGIGAATNPLEDLEEAQVIFVIGAQPSESHPVASYRIKRATRFKGARLVYASPLEDALSLMADLWLRILPGTELIVILGIIRILMQEGGWRKDLLGDRPKGWKALHHTVEVLEPSSVEELTGVDRGTLAEVAHILSSTRRCAIVFGAGISQSLEALEKVRALTNLALLLGCLGVSGGGIYPLDRGANTQGACDMGTLAEWLPGYRPVEDPNARAMMGRFWGREPPPGPGRTLCEMLEAARRGELKALYVLGENPAAMLPKEARETLDRLDLLVVQDLFTTETAQRAHMLLPGTGFAEKDGTYTSLERRVQRVRAAMKPPGDARADWWILAEILRRLDGGREYKTAADVMEEIAVLIPEYGGVHYSRLEADGLFWPCLDDRSLGEAILLREGAQKWKLIGHSIDPKTSVLPRDSDFPLIAMRGETHFHFQGGARSGRSQRLSTIFPHAEVHLHPEELATMTISGGDTVRLVSPHGIMKGVVHGRQEVPKGVAWVVPGPESRAMGDLMDWQWDPVTKMPLLYAASVRIEREGGEG